MKTYLITFLAIFYFFHAECQDVKVKKGSLLMDEVPVAAIEGKINIIKTDLTFKALDNSVLLTIIDYYYTFDLPQYKEFSYYKINFPKTEKTILLYKNLSYFNEKQISKFLFVDLGLQIKDNDIDPGSLSTFIEKYDETAKIVKDTINANELEKIFAEKLIENQIERNKSAEIVFKSVQSNNANRSINEIWQDNKLLGTFMVDVVYPTAPGASGSKPKYFYTVEKIINAPFEFDGVKYEKALVAHLIVDIGMLTKCITFQDKKQHDIPLIDGNEADVKKVCKYLINKGYL